MTEYFETFNPDGEPLGLVPRPQVHREGLWHKSAHVFLFTPNQELYLQRRAADKDLYADLWDYSIGEHLVPGETYHDAAQRGLQEELGIQGVDLQPVGGERAFQFSLPERSIADHEFQQAFTGVYDGEIIPDPAEVAEVRRIGLADLAAWIAHTPDQFTPPFLRDIFELGFVPRGTDSER